MQDTRKTKKQLIQELVALYQMRQTGATQHREITMSSPQGTVTWWSYRVSALTRVATGNGFLIVGTDITAQKATERVLRQQDRIMQKLQAESAVDLARQVFLAQST